MRNNARHRQSIVTFTRTVLFLSAAATALHAQTMADRVRPQIERALAAGSAFAGVSAASGSSTVAPLSLASIFGPGLATQTGSAPAPFPTSMGGVSVQIVDSAGASRAAQLLYVSPGQINFLMPAGVAAGQATVNLVNGGSAPLASTIDVKPVAPAIFTANGDGAGVVAATAFATAIPTQITAPVTVFRCGNNPGSCVSVPIDPGLDRPVTITLYATGLRGRSSDDAVVLTIGGQTVPIKSITAFDGTSQLAGVDEVAFPLVLGLRGLGETDLKLTVDGVSSNTARINIQ